MLPGFVDLHVHGGGGADAMAGEAAVRAMARFHAGHGTTSLLATTVTAPRDDLRRALGAIGAVGARRRPGEARVLGAHLEGPFISPRRARRPAAVRDPARSRAGRRAVRAGAGQGRDDRARDRSGPSRCCGACARHGVRVQLGHSCGSYEQAAAALAAGAAGFTHLFNAMTGMHHRGPGMVGAALAQARTPS